MKLLFEDLNNVRFTELLLALAEADFLGSRCKEKILDIPRSDLIKKSDYLFNLLDTSDSPITLDDLRETINCGNWGAPDYREDGSEFWE